MTDHRILLSIGDDDAVTAVGPTGVTPYEPSEAMIVAFAQAACGVADVAAFRREEIRRG